MAGATITINAASQALAVALEDYLDGLAVGTDVRFVFGPLNKNGTALATGDFPGGFGATGSAADFVTYTYTIKKATSSDNMIYCIQGISDALGGAVPLFWKITAAGSDALTVV